MRTVQQTALDLFDEKGFNEVSVEQIADKAEVSPSSIYRYFETKEGIILADDFDSLSDEELTTLIDPDDFLASCQAILSRLNLSSTGDPNNRSLAERRIRYFFDEPSVKRAAYEMLDAVAQRITTALVTKSRLDASATQVATTALVFGYFKVLEQWYRNPTDTPVTETLQHALEMLTRTKK